MSSNAAMPKRSKPPDHVPGAGRVTSMAASPSTVICPAPRVPWVRCRLMAPSSPTDRPGPRPPPRLLIDVRKLERSVDAFVWLLAGGVPVGCPGHRVLWSRRGLGGRGDGMLATATAPTIETVAPTSSAVCSP
jgi:hypothetical protein